MPKDSSLFEVRDVNNECLLAYFPNIISQIWLQPNLKFSDESFQGMTAVLQKTIDNLLINMYIDTSEKKAKKARVRAKKAAEKAVAKAAAAAAAVTAAATVEKIKTDNKTVRQGRKQEVSKSKSVQRPASKNLTEDKSKLEDSCYYLKDLHQQTMVQQGTYHFAV